MMANDLNSEQRSKLADIMAKATDDGVPYCGDLELIKRFRVACPELRPEVADNVVRGMIRAGRMMGHIPASAEPQLPPDYSKLPPEMALHRRMVDILVNNKDVEEMRRQLISECGNATNEQFKKAGEEGFNVLKERMAERKRRMETHARFAPFSMTLGTWNRA
ncbi:hypothetical protein U8P75_04400 [Rhizobium beringeri]|nr:hypothetical protein U8P75_04400 [Rhizobium beringeri]